MLVVLQSLADGASGRRVQLRSDQVLKVGSSGWADFSVSNDSTLEEVHFEVRCAPEGCIVRGLSSNAPTLVNGEPITSTVAYDGDEILAGATKFRLAIEGGPVPKATEEPEEQPTDEPTVAAAAAAAGAAVGLVGICALLELSDDVSALAEQSNDAEVLIPELAAQENYQDAVKLRAYLLEKRQAVWWGCVCLREELAEPLPTGQASAVDAAAAWVEQADDSTRREAEKKAADAKYSGPGATLALSAFWSGGSIAPDGSPEVEPDERLTSQGVTSALVAAAYSGDATTAPDRFQAFLARGKEVADGTITLPGQA